MGTGAGPAMQDGDVRWSLRVGEQGGLGDLHCSNRNVRGDAEKDAGPEEQGDLEHVREWGREFHLEHHPLPRPGVEQHPDRQAWREDGGHQSCQVLCHRYQGMRTPGSTERRWLAWCSSVRSAITATDALSTDLSRANPAPTKRNSRKFLPRSQATTNSNRRLECLRFSKFLLQARPKKNSSLSWTRLK